MLNLNKHTRTKPECKPTFNFIRTADMCAYHCVHLSKTTQNSCDNLPSFPPDGHHSSAQMMFTGAEAVFLESIAM